MAFVNSDKANNAPKYQFFQIIHSFTSLRKKNRIVNVLILLQ